MSHLENRTKPLLVALLGGQRVTVGRGRQIMLATWATKTALVHASSRHEPNIIPQSDYKGFYETKAPNQHTQAWLGLRWAGIGELQKLLVIFIGAVAETDELPVPPDYRALALLSLGIAEGAYDEALRYAGERKQFGRPIGSFQGVSFQLADMATEIQAGTHLLYHAAWLKQNGRPFKKEAAMAKLFCSELAMRATTKAVQIFGGYGYTTEYPVERMMRDAKVCEIGEGTSEIQRIVIARQILGQLGD